MCRQTALPLSPHIQELCLSVDFELHRIRRDKNAVPTEKAEGLVSEGDTAASVGAEQHAEGAAIRPIVHKLPASLGIDQHTVYLKVLTAT